MKKAIKTGSCERGTMLKSENIYPQATLVRALKY